MALKRAVLESQVIHPVSGVNPWGSIAFWPSSQHMELGLMVLGADRACGHGVSVVAQHIVLCIDLQLEEENTQMLNQESDV